MLEEREVEVSNKRIIRAGGDADGVDFLCWLTIFQFCKKLIENL